MGDERKSFPGVYAVKGLVQLHVPSRFLTPDEAFELTEVLQKAESEARTWHSIRMNLELAEIRRRISLGQHDFLTAEPESREPLLQVEYSLRDRLEVVRDEPA